MNAVGYNSYGLARGITDNLARPAVGEMTLHLTPEISGDLALKIVSEIRHELFTSDHKLSFPL